MMLAEVKAGRGDHCFNYHFINTKKKNIPLDLESSMNLSVMLSSYVKMILWNLCSKFNFYHHNFHLFS